MCGIAGIFKFHEQAFPEELEPILTRLGHRGPDNTATWHCNNVALGHTRLSVIDLSTAADQPMHDPQTGNTIVFNGEIYNFQDLRTELEAKGHVFQTSSDTEVLLKLYAELGEACMEKLRGMFAFAIWDARRQAVFIARDRLGKKPFHYAETQGGILFASEIRALAAHPLVQKTPDQQSIDIFLTTGLIPSPRSIYQDIQKLPPAHCGWIDSNGLHFQRYWELDFRNKIEIDERQAMVGLQTKLEKAVRRRMVTDVPLGALLSGGVDSSLIVALMAQQSSTRIKTFTVGFEEKKFDETEHAKIVANHLGVEHHVEILEPRNLEEMLPEAIHWYGEPFSDDASLPSLLLCKATRKHVTVALGGDGGDEIGCGYTSYIHAKLAQKVNALLSLGPANSKKVRALYRKKSAATAILRNLTYKYIRPEYKHLLRNDRNLHEKTSRLYLSEMRAHTSNTVFDWRLKGIQTSYKYAHNPVERLLWADTSINLPELLLVKMDIASMAHSLEIRSPLLDQELMEYMASLPVSLKIKGNMTKYLLKKLAEKFVPAKVLYRPKQGFSMPVAQWLRSSAADFMNASFTEASPFLSQFLDMNQLTAITTEHLSGRRKHKNLLWRLLNLAQWAIHFKQV